MRDDLLLAPWWEDLLSLRKIHPATALASAWVITVELMSVPLSSTAAWDAFAAWSQ